MSLSAIEILLTISFMIEEKPIAIRIFLSKFKKK